MSTAVSVRQLDYRVGKGFALRDLAMHVPTGAIYGFLGPNGSGKSTTIKLLLGMLEADAGTIELLGEGIPSRAHQVLARVGYVPERPHLYPVLTVEETLRYHGAFYATWDRGEAERLRRAFALRADQPVARLSKGETGKLMMLLALAARPELLILDEPTDGLDPVVRRDVLAALVDYVAARRATVLVSSHLVHEQERICDWVGVLDDGRMLAELPMEQFRAGIKRLRVRNAAAVLPPALPFALLGRTPAGPLGAAGSAVRADELWIVREWQPAMRDWFAEVGAELRDVEDLDLEESFVELLRTARHRAGAAGALGAGEAA